MLLLYVEFLHHYTISDHLIFEKEHKNKPLVDDFATRAIDRKLDGLSTNKEDDLVVAPHLVDKQTIPDTLRQELNNININNDKRTITSQLTHRNQRIFPSDFNDKI